MTTKNAEIKESRLLNVQEQVYRSFSQIGSTTKFEFIRNKWNLVIGVSIAAVVYLLFLIVNVIQQARGAELPTNNVDYINSYFLLIDILVLVIAITFAGTIIAEDFQKDTGNLIFPKTTRERLLTGRIIARYLYAAVSMTVFYLLVGVTTLGYYGTIDTMFFASWALTLLYTFVIFSFVAFFSSLMRSNAATIITSILVILIVYNLLAMVLQITGFAWEPFFIVTYYSSIITNIYDMPVERFAEVPMAHGPGAGDATVFRWITPSITGAVIGMIIYATILIVITYIVFRFRQKK